MADFPRSPEGRLLASCARVRVDPRQLRAIIREGPRWDRLLEAASHHGMEPMVYDRLAPARDAVPPRVLGRLQRAFERNGLRNLERYARLRVLVASLHAQGIRVAALKGAALAALVYRNPGLRPMIDVDLLVPRESLARAEDVVRALDYRELETPHDRDWYLARHHHARPYGAADGALTVELHHHLLSGEARRWLPIDELWERTVSTRIGPIEVDVLCPTDTVLHVAVHLAHTNRFMSELRAVRDLAECVDRHGAAIDWDALVERAGRYRLTRAVRLALWAAHEIGGAPIPASVLGPRRRPPLDALGHALVRRALQDDEVSPVISPWMIRESLAALTSEEPMPRVVGALARVAARTYGESVREAGPSSPLPRWLYATLVHPVWLVGRALARLVGARQ